ncbi:MAG: hypothetical protein JWM74_1373 [Myxococcaceae bacterium]|jgi:hypothetical protein|nr:hypothetical protein [Myxococcaceae bacterium]
MTSPNPYEAPRAHAVVDGAQAHLPASLRAPFLLAAIGAWLASAYWAALTMLLAFGIATQGVSPMQVLFPCILIVLYAVRGYQLFKGNPAAAKRILWLHGVGVAVTLLNMVASHDSVLFVFQSIKVAINLFGGVTAYLAHRAFSHAQAGRP